MYSYMQRNDRLQEGRNVSSGLHPNWAAYTIKQICCCWSSISPVANKGNSIHRYNSHSELKVQSFQHVLHSRLPHCCLLWDNVPEAKTKLNTEKIVVTTVKEKKEAGNRKECNMATNSTYVLEGRNQDSKQTSMSGKTMFLTNSTGILLND